MLCPRCNKKLKTIRQKPTEREKEWCRKKLGIEIKNHTSFWRFCVCGYRGQETWVNGKIIASTEFNRLKTR